MKCHFNGCHLCSSYHAFCLFFLAHIFIMIVVYIVYIILNNNNNDIKKKNNLQYTVSGNLKVTSNLKNLLDTYNISPIQKSMFGHFFDSLKFFYQQKGHEFKYIFDEVGITYILTHKYIFNILID